MRYFSLKWKHVHNKSFFNEKPRLILFTSLSWYSSPHQTRNMNIIDILKFFSWRKFNTIFKYPIKFDKAAMVTDILKISWKKSRYLVATRKVKWRNNRHFLLHITWKISPSIFAVFKVDTQYSLELSNIFLQNHVKEFQFRQNSFNYSKIFMLENDRPKNNGSVSL